MKLFKDHILFDGYCSLCQFSKYLAYIEIEHTFEVSLSDFYAVEMFKDHIL